MPGEIGGQRTFRFARIVGRRNATQPAQVQLRFTTGHLQLYCVRDTTGCAPLYGSCQSQSAHCTLTSRAMVIQYVGVCRAMYEVNHIEACRGFQAKPLLTHER